MKRVKRMAQRGQHKAYIEYAETWKIATDTDLQPTQLEIHQNDWFEQLASSLYTLQVSLLPLIGWIPDPGSKVTMHRKFDARSPAAKAPFEKTLFLCAVSPFFALLTYRRLTRLNKDVWATQSETWRDHASHRSGLYHKKLIILTIVFQINRTICYESML